MFLPAEYFYYDPIFHEKCLLKKRQKLPLMLVTVPNFFIQRKSWAILCMLDVTRTFWCLIDVVRLM